MDSPQYRPYRHRPRKIANVTKRRESERLVAKTGRRLSKKPVHVASRLAQIAAELAQIAVAKES